MSLAYDAPDMSLTGSEAMPGVMQEPDAVEAETPAQPNALAQAADVQEEHQFEKLRRWADPRQTLNIADELEPDELSRIGSLALEEYNIDLQSRADWLTRSKDAMKLAMQVVEKKDHPWPNASNVVYPLMTVAAIQFAARAYPAVVTGKSVVKGVVCGSDNGVPAFDEQGQPIVLNTPDGPKPTYRVPPGDKLRRASRVADHMSYQFLNEQPEWEEDTDKMLHILPIVGCCFRKTFFDPGLRRNMGLMVTAENLVINYWAKSMELAPRISEEVRLYPREIEESKRAGTFLDEDYEIGAASNDKDAPIEFVEQHRYIDLDGDDYSEPYIVTFEKKSGKVARIIANYDPESIFVDESKNRVAKITPVSYYTKYGFIPNPEGGIYDVGFGQLLMPVNEAVNTTLNMLIDAGHRQVVGGGFIGRGLSLRGGSIKFKMGEYLPINATGSAIRDAVVHMEAPAPSAVLYSLLGSLIEAGKEIASVKDILSGDSSASTMQPTTLLALIEQGLKVFTSIYKRVHRSLKHEYDKQYRLNRIYLDDHAGYRNGDEWKEITRADYAHGSGVEPVSDPAMVTDMQRLGRSQWLGQFMNDPLCEPIEIRRRMFESASIEQIDKVLKTKLPQAPPDPKLLLQGEQLKQRDREIALKEISTKAKAISDLAAAANSLAQADKATADATLKFASHQLEDLRVRMEMLDDPVAAASSEPLAPAAPPGPGNIGGGIPELAAPSGDQVVS